MRRTLSQPNLVPASHGIPHEQDDSPGPLLLLRRNSQDRAAHQADATSPRTPPARTTRQLSLNSSIDFMHGHPGPATSVRSTQRSQIHKCLAPATPAGINLASHGHGCKPNSLPPRAVMRSFLSAQGHLSSAGRLAKPACSTSSSCLSAIAQKESSMSTSDLSSDLLHALERQGRNSIDYANSSSLAPSRHSMDTDEGQPGATATHANVALLPTSSAPLSSCPMTAPRHSIGSRTDSAAAPENEEHSSSLRAAPRCGNGAREWCGADADTPRFVPAWPIVPAASNVAAAAAGTMLQGSMEGPLGGEGDTGPHRVRGRLHHATVALHGAKPWACHRGIPLHAVFRSDHGTPGHKLRAAAAAAPPHPPPAPAVAVAMSSALFRPAPVPSGVPVETVAAAAPQSATSNDSCTENAPGQLSYGGPPAPPEAEARPSMDTAFETELLMRVARTRQTMDFAARQRATIGTLRIAALPLWDALHLLDTLSPTPATPAALSPLDHALLCAQWCAHELPQFDWAPLVGLMHSLGRLLSHELFGSEPAWAVTSESYPLGCRFSEAISGHDFLAACPDRRCSAYATPTGIYASRCGFDAMHFTWTAAEYLSLVVAGSGGRLPFAATFLLRYQGFESAIAEGAYAHLASAADEAVLPTLRKFTAICRAAAEGLLEEPPGGPTKSAMAERCSRLFAHYFPPGELRF